MARMLWCGVVLAGLVVLGVSSGAEKQPRQGRVPWDTSRVVGSPEPPPPFRVERAFPNVRIANALYLIREPGTDYLLALSADKSYQGPGRVHRFLSRPDVKDLQLALEIDRVPYGIAFHPDYARNGYLYLCSNGPDGKKPKKNRLSRYTVDRSKGFHIDPKSELVILEWETDGHNGGDLAFGRDGYLYITSGDGTSDSDTNGRGQDLTELTAKVLRLDVDRPDGDRPYSVPKDNPFVGRKDCRPETWAYGLRNPWKLTVDPETGHVWVGNNGQDLWEQIYFVRKGDNYGWAAFEGGHPFHAHRQLGPDPHVKPAVEHHHSEARSLTGGVVYYGQRFPELRGAYVYGDYSTGRIWGVRHDGTKVVWHQELADTDLAITGFGADARGELIVVDHQQGYYRLERRPPQAAAHPFPRRLSETGLFSSVKDHEVHPALVPYTVNAPLWSDGAHKERYLALPGTTLVEPLTTRAWTFPEGTVLVKSFALDLEEGKPASRRRIETRLFTKQQGEWAGYSYVWNDAQTDAELVGAAGMDRVYTIRDPRAAGGSRAQTWHYPSRQECMACHSRAAGFVLGPSTAQMNQGSQLERLERLGVFRIGWPEHGKELKGWTRQGLNNVKGAAGFVADVLGLPKPPPAWADAVQRSMDRLERRVSGAPGHAALLPRRPDTYIKLVDPADRSAPLESRARSYLHANCAGCHVEAGGGNAAFTLEVTVPLEKTKLIDVKPMHDTFGIPDARLISPGHPEKSILYQRITRRGRGQMPPLGTLLVDEEAARVIHDWIRQMK